MIRAYNSDMYRPLLIAALAALLATVPLSAQHGGGGHASGGGHGGFAGHGGFGGHMGGGGHAFGGMHSGSGFAGHSFAGGSSFGRGFSRGSRFGRGRGRSGVGLRLRSYGYGNNCWGYGCWWGYGYPYLGGGVDPYWWWDSDSSDPDPGPQYDNGLANQMNQQGLYPRPMPYRGDQDAYAQSAPPPPRQEASSTVVPATVLVYRDQRKQEVQNYAIVGQTLWIFSPERTQKVPLADVDIDATQKANDARGVDFRVPSVDAGQ